jgi:splicing factor 3B subunit 4
MANIGLAMPSGSCAVVHLQAVKVLNMIKVYGKPIRVNKASQDKRSQDMGANLFIGNLDPEVDEKVRFE